MRRGRKTLVFASAALLFVAVPVWGDETSSASTGEKHRIDNKWYDRVLEGIPKIGHEKAGTPVEQLISANNILEKRTRGGTIWMDWSMNREPKGVEEEPLKDVEPQPQADYLTAFAPVHGQLAALHGDFYKEAIKNGMKGVVAKQMIAFAQTEPGVFAGVQAAENITADKLALRFQAEDHFKNQLPENEWARQRAITAYNACIAKLQKKKGWLNAANACMGDSNEEPQESHKAKAPKEDEIFQPKQHPSNDEETAKDVAECEEEKEICVVAQLFNQDAKHAGSSGGNENIDELAKSFKKMFGDYKLVFKNETNTNSGGTLNTTRTLQEDRVPPDPTYHIAKVLKKIVYNRYEDILFLTNRACWHYYDGGLNETHENAPSASDGKKYHFWTKVVMEGWANHEKDMIRRLSIPEYPFQGAVVDAILDMYKNALKKRGNNTNPDAEINCNIWGVSDGDDPEKIKEDDKNLRYYSLLYDYARFVAVDQLLRTFMEVEKYIINRSAGPGKSLNSTKAAALELVYSVARTNDLQGARMKNIEELEQFVEEKIFKARAQEVGRQGAAQGSTNQNFLVDERQNGR